MQYSIQKGNCKSKVRCHKTNILTTELVCCLSPPAFDLTGSLDPGGRFIGLGRGTVFSGVWVLLSVLCISLGILDTLWNSSMPEYTAFLQKNVKVVTISTTG